MSKLQKYIKGLVYHLSHNCHFDIDRDVSTAHYRSSSSDSVDLLSRTICTTLVVSDWCITFLAHCWWVFDPKHCWYCQRKKLIPQRSAVTAIGCYVCDCWYPCFRNLNSTAPVDCGRMKSYVDSLFNSSRGPVTVLVNLTSSQKG